MRALQDLGSGRTRSCCVACDPRTSESLQSVSRKGVEHMDFPVKMGGLWNKHRLPPSWRDATRHGLSPSIFPGKRVVRVDYALGWFRIRKIPGRSPHQVQAGYLSRLWALV